MVGLTARISIDCNINWIDDDVEDTKEVKERYIENAVEAFYANQNPTPATTKVIGCSIKVIKKEGLQFGVLLFNQIMI
jgi:hypothetical protein